LSVWLFSAILLAFFTEGLAFFEKINLTTLDRQSSGHEWTANSSLHTRTINLVLVHCGCHTGK